MKVLFISNLFPDTTEPYRGLDNSIVLHHLAASCAIRVISPRPTLPLTGAKRGRDPRPEDAAFQPAYPPVPYVPKIGSRVNHRLFASSIESAVLTLHQDFPFEVILCSWAYPDVSGVARLASRLQVPFVAIVQGTDVHSYLTMPVRKRLIVAALNQASAVITRSRDLARRLETAGVASEKLHTIYNGVDSAVFKPGDRAAARRELDLPPDAEIALFVGNFYPIKDPLLALAAHLEWTRSEPQFRRLLVFVGGGPMEADIRKAARAGGVEDLVILAGRQSSSRVAEYMQAANCLLLTSHNEGLPNVILEAISCALPVVATNVGGIAEVLSHPTNRGRLVDARDPRSIAAAITEAKASGPSDNPAPETPPPFRWAATAEKYLTLIRSACGN